MVERLPEVCGVDADRTELVNAGGKVAPTDDVVGQLCQDDLDLRAATEQRLAGVVDATDTPRRALEAGHARGLETIFGDVGVTRLAYRRRGEQNLYPADAALNLPTELHSHGLRELCAIESARGSFEEATESIRRATGAQVGKPQVEALAVRSAVDFEALDTWRPTGTSQPGSSSLTLPPRRSWAGLSPPTRAAGRGTNGCGQFCSPFAVRDELRPYPWVVQFLASRGVLPDRDWRAGAMLPPRAGFDNHKAIQLLGFINGSLLDGRAVWMAVGPETRPERSTPRSQPVRTNVGPSASRC
jgi:hypothetical protein